METDSFMDALAVTWKLQRRALRPRRVAPPRPAMRVVGVPTRADVAELVNQIGGAPARGARAAPRARGALMAPSLLKRQPLRTRNGLAHLAGLERARGRPDAAATSCGSARPRACGATAPTTAASTPPLLIVHSLVSKSYILDLLPENSMIRFLVGEGFDVYLLDWEPAGPGRRREHARDLRRRPTSRGAIAPRESRRRRADADRLLLRRRARAAHRGGRRRRPPDPQPRRAHHAVRLPRIGFLADMFRRGPARRRRRHRRAPASCPPRVHGRRLPVDQADRPARAAAEPVGAAVERGAGRELPRAQRLDARPGAVPGRDVPPDRRAAGPRQPPARAASCRSPAAPCA